LQTRGIPVYVVFGQSFDHLLEFQDTNNDSLFNLYRYGRNDTTAGDQPVKATGLVRAWTATVPSVEPAGNTTYVNFTVGTPDLPRPLRGNAQLQRVRGGDGREVRSPDRGVGLRGTHQPPRPRDQSLPRLLRTGAGRAVHSRRVPLGGDGQRHVPPAGERHDGARPPAPHSRLRILQRRVGPGDGHRGPPRVAERRDGRWARGDDAVPGPGRGAVPRRL